MNMPKHIARKATTRIGSTRSAADGASVEGPPGRVVAAEVIDRARRAIRALP